MGLAQIRALSTQIRASGPSGSTGKIEYGSDGSPWGGVDFTPWPGLVSGTETAAYVTEEVAAGLPGIGRGVELITGVLSQLHPGLYKNANDPTQASERLETPALLTNPDPMWHGLPEWLTAVGASMIWYGDAFAYRGPEVTDRRGYPTRLPLFSATRMRWHSTEKVYVYQTTDGEQTIERADMAHFLVGARAGWQMGSGILERYQRELKLMLATENSQYVLMKDGKPMGILSLGVDVNTEQASDYKEGFLKAVRESGVAAIGNADFKPVQWSSADLSMIPTREFNLRIASDIVGVPPYLLGVPSESRVYSNMENEWTTFIRVTLGRYLQAMESTLTGCFPRGSTVKFDTDMLMQSDAKTRMDIDVAGVSAGIFEVNEARAGWDLPPITEPEPEPVPDPLQEEDDTDEGDADE